MGYRERRLARAERLRGWAEKREAKQGALNNAARCDEAHTGIPFGQPILVGHHSERRHRNAIAKIDRAMRASIDNANKAASMNSRAAGIEMQAEDAIYSGGRWRVESPPADIHATHAPMIEQLEGWANALDAALLLPPSGVNTPLRQIARSTVDAMRQVAADLAREEER